MNGYGHQFSLRSLCIGFATTPLLDNQSELYFARLAVSMTRSTSSSSFSTATAVPTSSRTSRPLPTEAVHSILAIDRRVINAAVMQPTFLSAISRLSRVRRRPRHQLLDLAASSCPTPASGRHTRSTSRGHGAVARRTRLSGSPMRWHARSPARARRHAPAPLLFDLLVRVVA
jgi:hypothetical protein